MPDMGIGIRYVLTHAYPAISDKLLLDIYRTLGDTLITLYETECKITFVPETEIYALLSLILSQKLLGKWYSSKYFQARKTSYSKKYLLRWTR